VDHDKWRKLIKDLDSHDKVRESNPRPLKKCITKFSETVSLFVLFYKLYVYNKKSMLRGHKPPLIRRIRISDFGLPDPKRDPDRHQNCITWSLSHALPLQKFLSKSVHKFASNPTDRHTNRPHQKHNLRRTSAEVITIRQQSWLRWYWHV